MDVIKMFLTLSDFVTPCLWQLTLKDCLWGCLPRFTTTESQTELNTWQLLIILQTDMFEDLQMTGLLTFKNNQIYQHSVIWHND